MGDWEYDTDVNGNDGKKHTGWHYRWAGDWMDGWFEVEGNWYFAEKNYPRMTATGYAYIMRKGATATTDLQYHLMTKDKMGAFMIDYTGTYEVSAGKYSFLQNGVRMSESNKLYRGDDGYYYFSDGSGYILTNTSKYITPAWANGHIKITGNGRSFFFDKYGRLTENLIKETATIKNEINAATEVIGRVMTVKHTAAVRVVYLLNDKYVTADAMVNPYASQVAAMGDEVVSEYNFAIPADAKEVKIVLKGDVSGDGKIGAEDMDTLIQALTADDADNVLDSLQKAILDIDGDGEITSADRILLARALMNSNHEKYEELFKELAW